MNHRHAFPRCAYSCSAGFIQHQTDALHCHCYSVRISLRSRRLLRILSSAAATVEGHCCHLPPPPAQLLPKCCSPLTFQQRNPWERRNLSYPVLSSRAMYSLNLSLAILSSPHYHVPGVRRLIDHDSRVPRGQGRKVV